MGQAAPGARAIDFALLILLLLLQRNLYSFCLKSSPLPAMAGFLRIPSELHAFVFSCLESADCRALASCCRSLHRWREYAWRTIEVWSSTTIALADTLSMLNRALDYDDRLGAMVRKLYIREPYGQPGHLVVDTPQLDILLAKLLNSTSGLRTFLLDAPRGGKGPYSLTLEAMRSLPVVETISLGRVIGPRNREMTPPMTSNKLRSVIVAWADDIDVGAIIRNQLLLEYLHVEPCLYPPQPDLNIGIGWVELEQLSMGLDCGNDLDEAWSEWIGIVETALVSTYIWRSVTRKLIYCAVGSREPKEAHNGHDGWA